MFIAPQIRLSEEQVRGGGKSYTYLFTPESSLPLIKCGHAIELSAVFNHPELTYYYMPWQIWTESFFWTGHSVYRHWYRSIRLTNLIVLVYREQV